MKRILYDVLSWGFQDFVWRGFLLDSKNLPQSGPAVLVANHLGALGPIAVGGCVPLILHTWIHADMLNPRLAAEYLRRDFIEPQLHLALPLSRWLAAFIAKIHVPLLRSIGTIPVHHDADGLLKTYRQSVDLLEQGQCILIFPEDPSQPMDSRFKMTPFKKGFARLGELFFERTGAALAFYPLAVRAESRTVQSGLPVRYNPLNPVSIERQRIKSVLEESIHAMILQPAPENYVTLPLVN